MDKSATRTSLTIK